ncbi:MAG: redoxin [Pirellulaceae bacterium]
MHDIDQRLTRALKASSTTDAFILDAARTVLYHGAVDDQYGVGVALDEPRHRWLNEALDAVLRGERPLVEATFAPGCLLDTDVETQGDRAPSVAGSTYHAEIARIMQRHCVSCHREQGVGPFPLDTYRDVVAHAAMIREVVEQGIMPPWFAVDAANDSSVSPWANDRTLPEQDRRLLLEWLDSAHEIGDEADAPVPLEFDGAWSIGEPDAVFGFETPVDVRATGVMPYQNIRVETNLPEDRWVRAIEIMPGVREVVHHVLVFVETPSEGRAGRAGLRRQLPDDNDETGGFWAAYVPGNSTLLYPDGFAKRLPAGATLRFQMHYTPVGRAVQDTTRIGVVFADEPPEHEVKVHGLANIGIRIPAEDPAHREIAEMRIPRDVEVLAFMPHMHLRGKACRYEIEGASATTTLLDIPRYDFNWQLLYRYAEPKRLRAGETLRFIGWFDNSADNPANPDPSRLVRWGPQTTDEMLLGYVEYVEVHESSADQGGAEPAVDGDSPADIPRAQRLLLTRAFEQLDSDRNGQLSYAEFARAGERFPRLQRFEARAQPVFQAADRDGNEQLDGDEFLEAGARLLERIRGN